MTIIKKVVDEIKLYAVCIIPIKITDVKCSDIYDFLSYFKDIDNSHNSFNNALINLNIDDVNYIKSLDVFVTTGSAFNPLSDDFIYSQSFQTDDLPNIVLNDFNPNLTENQAVLPFYLHLIPNTYFSSGTKTTTSGIKNLNLDVNILPSRINNLTGLVVPFVNATDKKLSLEALLSWDRVPIVQDCSFEVAIKESGSSSNEYHLFTQNSSIENILQIGTGTGYGIDYNYFDNIFSKYSTSGIQWLEHTIELNNFGTVIWYSVTIT